MKYVIETNVNDGDVSDPMEYADAREEFMMLTGEFLSKTCVDGEEIICDETTLRPANPAELTYVEDGVLNLDGIVEEFSDERIRVAYDRAVKEFGGVIADPESDEFQEELGIQLTKLATSDLLQFFEREGDLKINLVNKDGDIVYEAVG